MKAIFPITLLAVFLTALMPARSAEVSRVSLITCGPGSEIYELEGHTALRLVYDDGRDISVNWGTFDFNTPNFIYRFVKGETDYRMAIYPTALFIEQYRQEGRWMKERKLNLTDEEMQVLGQLIEKTIPKPVYRYNYIKDNCATRPVAYIDASLTLAGDSGPKYIDFGLSGADDNGSFRKDMTYFHQNYPWYQFGIDLALGSGIDYSTTWREKIFAPVFLDNMLRIAFVEDSVGLHRRIAQEPVVILEETYGGPKGPTPFLLTPMFVCWAFFCIVLAICLYDVRRKKITLWIQSLTYSLASLAGLLLTFLIFVSVHEATSPNWLYLWLNPLCLIGAIGVWIKKCKTVVFCWQIINFVAIIALVVVAAAGVQRLNPAFWPLMLADISLSLTWMLLCRPKKH